jgi:hypothetical protein
MLVEGRREIALLQNIKQNTKIDAMIGLDDVSAIKSSFKKLGDKIDSAFLSHLEECWLLERDEDLRRLLDDTRVGYEKYRLHAFWVGILSLSEAMPEEKKNIQLSKLRELGQSKIDEYKGPTGKELLLQLGGLRKVLARTHYHKKTYVEIFFGFFVTFVSFVAKKVGKKKEANDNT